MSESPSWHHASGKDVGGALLTELEPYPEELPHSFIQCFDPAELKRLRTTTQTRLPFVQLIGLDSWGHAGIDYRHLLTPAGLQDIATYANAIGPHLNQILVGQTASGSPQFSDQVEKAHAFGLEVIPYPLRQDSLPPHTTTPEGMLEVFLAHAHLDGIFTDHPDTAINWISEHYGERPD